MRRNDPAIRESARLKALAVEKELEELRENLRKAENPLDKLENRNRE
ncbi:MAG: hypothetical protein KF696_13760 [Planctomycetes bacterium]|nr:hypothetical protein [Planctomycetota bacterium]MCW8137060.1 hypothetical protein [Planctomycetota bacterium]